MGWFTKKKVDNSPEDNSQINNSGLSGKIPDDAGCSPDNFLFNCNNTDSIINPVIEKVDDKQHNNIQEKKVDMDLGLEEKVLNFIKESKDGRNVSEITGLIDSFNEDYSVKDLLSMMVDKGIIKKYKQRYYILEEN